MPNTFMWNCFLAETITEIMESTSQTDESLIHWQKIVVQIAPAGAVCPISLEPLKPTQSVTRCLSCQQIFGYEELCRWLWKKRVCPCCTEYWTNDICYVSAKSQPSKYALFCKNMHAGKLYSTVVLDFNCDDDTKNSISKKVDFDMLRSNLPASVSTLVKAISDMGVQNSMTQNLILFKLIPSP